jgi:hypothetical protein
MTQNEELLQEMLGIIHKITTKFDEIKSIWDLIDVFQGTNFAVYSIDRNEVKLLNDVDGFPKSVRHSPKKADNAVSNIAKNLKIDAEKNILEFVLWRKDGRFLFIRKMENKEDHHVQLAWTFFETIKNILKAISE